MSQAVARTVALLVGWALLGAVCAPAAAPPASPTSPAKPAATAAPTASAPAAAAASPAAKPAAPPTTVQMATLRAASDAGLFIALERGYFTEQGIDGQFAEIGLGSDIAAMLAAGQIQVGGAAITAGLLNAATRGVETKIVADKGANPRGFSFGGLIVRKDLVDSGEYQGPADLRGRKIAVPDLVSGGTIELDYMLRRAGLTVNDADVVSMPFPDTIPALGNRAIDASISIEPFITIATANGSGVRAISVDEVPEGHQIAVLMYGLQFANTEAAKRFMVAYVKGLRDYNDAFVKNQNLDAVVDIIAKHSATKDPALIKRMVPAGLNPDGYVNEQSIEGDLNWYFERGHVSERPDLKRLVDNSYVDYAIQQLGRYNR
jgi:ABC-type nitrate/sulfonate/bicarbonate transport system substrate-binding protein